LAKHGMFVSIDKEYKIQGSSLEMFPVAKEKKKP